MGAGGAPHVVMLVGNDVSVDGRVQKTAASLVAAGLRVTIIDHDPKGGTAPAAVAGCEVIRPKVSSELAGGSLVSGDRVRELVWSVLRGGRFTTARQLRRATYRRKLRERTIASRIVALKLAMGAPAASAGLLPRFWHKLRNRGLVLVIEVLRRWLRLRRSVLRYRTGGGRPSSSRDDRYSFASSSVEVSALDMRRDWRTTVPDAAAIELAAASVVDRLEPDAIHAHDYLMLPTGAEAVRRARAGGRSVPLVYDAHEYVRGLTTHHDERRRAVAAMEARFIRDADAVVTVSPALARRLDEDHDLPETPTVVLNAPLRSAVSAPDDGGLRGRLELPDGARLLVYSGNVTPARGIHTLVHALPMLAEDVHLAIVTAHRVPYLVGLLDEAEEAGTRHRIHLAPYVEPEQVPAYLSTGDVGVHPMRRYPNGDIALPNKLFEYLHARLPIVISDCPAQADFVSSNGIGEVFTADDPADLAAKVETVLGDLRHYRDAYGEELLAAHAWERQHQHLLAVYERLGLVESAARAASDTEVGASVKRLLEGEAD